MTETITPQGERIAKRLSRAGIASRREAERMIAAGRVTVNGAIIDSPALNVTDADRITVDGVPVGAAERPRLWLYHKPLGLVTTAKDEKGRETVFDTLPAELPRVMSVGRLDINSEGLLLLTNDGGVKRKLELPSTGWLRKYRVRVKGNPTEAMLEPLRKGVTIEGERFQPMEVVLDRQQGANAWLTIGIREGKNREIRRAMMEVGLDVNRLIRISYGPFRLNELKAGEVEEVKPRVLRDQLGLEAAVAGHAVAKPQRKMPGSNARSGKAGAGKAEAGKGPSGKGVAGKAAPGKEASRKEAPRKEVKGKRPQGGKPMDATRRDAPRAAVRPTRRHPPKG